MKACFRFNQLISVSSHLCSIGVRLGEHQLSTKEDCRSIRGRRRCTTYEEFGIEEVITDDEHDIALLRLSRDVTIKRKWRRSSSKRFIYWSQHLYTFTAHIAPVCLPLNETLQATEQTAEYFSLTGWGFLENPKDSDVLLESYVDAVKSSNAFELWAVRRDNSGCHGDLGSPLTQVDIYLEYQRNVQVGVLISGARDCTEGLPMHFASISAVMPWIAQEIGKADVREFRTMLS